MESSKTRMIVDYVHFHEVSDKERRQSGPYTTAVPPFLAGRAHHRIRMAPGRESRARG